MQGNASSSTNRIIVVQGAQWGSEAKGMVCDALGRLQDVDIMVRTGTVNAGHTVYYAGFPHKMQQLPVGWTNPRTMLYLGPGAYIHPDILVREIEEIRSVTGEDVRHRLYVDYRCGLHLPTHTTRAQAANRHHKMGATGKGCSEAVMDKIGGRGTDRGMLFKEWLRTKSDPIYSPLDNLQFEDTVALLNSSWDNGAKILIEGTQGTLLDLHTGPYPYTTHKQTACGNWIAESGLSPSLPYEVVSVARSYPIRVAGNSGPMPREISWVDLARKINRRLENRNLPPRVKEDSLVQFEQACCEVAARHHNLGDTDFTDIVYRDQHRIEKWSPEQRLRNQKFVSELHTEALNLLPGPVVEDLKQLFEMTTVTNKLRRVAELDLDSLRYSCILNRPAYIVLTFANYVQPEIWGARGAEAMSRESQEDLLSTVRVLENMLGYPIKYVTTGPEIQHFVPVSSLNQPLLRYEADKVAQS